MSEPEVTRPEVIERRQVAIAATLGGLALGLRLLAARGDLWLDEIWALDGVRSLHSALGVFTAIRSENNHYLTSLYLWLLGDQAGYWAYRVPSVLAGALTTLLGALPPFSRRPREALVVGLLLATSPLLVQYDSEARGYALAALCAVAAYGCFDRYLHSGGWGPALGFALWAGLGLLGHLTFLYALFGFAAWGGWERYRRWQPDPRLAVALGLPLGLFALLWRIDLRMVMPEGGKVEPLSRVINEWAGALLGLPPSLAVIVLGLGIAALGVEGERPADRRWPWIFFLVAIAVAPALALLLRSSPYVAPRYFVVGSPFVLLLLSQGLVRLAELGRTGLQLAGATLALLVAGGLYFDVRLIALGRGDYSGALAYLCEHTSGPEVTVGSDHDFRNSKVVNWYDRRLRDHKPLHYEPTTEWATHPPEWLLVHDPATWKARDALTGPQGPYQLAQRFPHAGLSGWDWLAYHRVEASK